MKLIRRAISIQFIISLLLLQLDESMGSHDVVQLAPGNNALIEHVLTDTGSDGAKIVAQVMNREYIAGTFAVKLVHCALDSPGAAGGISNDVEPISDSKRIKALGARLFSIDLHPYQLRERMSCYITLVNEYGQNIAVREICLQPKQTCLCVHTCKCSCGDENNLKCEPLPVERIIATGLIDEVQALEVLEEKSESQSKWKLIFHWIVVAHIVITIVALCICLHKKCLWGGKSKSKKKDGKRKFKRRNATSSGGTTDGSEVLYERNPKSTKTLYSKSGNSLPTMSEMDTGTSLGGSDAESGRNRGRSSQFNQQPRPPPPLSVPSHILDPSTRPSEGKPSRSPSRSTTASQGMPSRSPSRPATPSAAQTGPGAPSGAPSQFNQGPPTAAPSGAPSQYQQGPPTAAPSGTPSQYQQGPRTAAPSGAPSQYRQGPPTAALSGAPSQYNQGPRPPPPRGGQNQSAQTMTFVSQNPSTRRPADIQINSSVSSQPSPESSTMMGEMDHLLHRHRHPVNSGPKYAAWDRWSPDNNSLTETNADAYLTYMASANSSKTSLGAWNRKKRDQPAAYDFLPSPKRKESY